jgi:broad specificity phosphatase PhoE
MVETVCCGDPRCQDNWPFAAQAGIAQRLVLIMAIGLTLISHARTPALARACFPCDEPIGDKHIGARSKAISHSLRRIDRAWMAPELRTRQTAAAVGLSGAINPILTDCDYGTWRGLRLSEVQARDPDGLAAWLSDVEAVPHGGESISNVLRRIGIWLSQHKEPGHTVAVTHPSVVRAAIVHTLNAPAEAFWRIDVEPLSVTNLRCNGAHWTLRSMGRAPGLLGRLRVNLARKNGRLEPHSVRPLLNGLLP